MALLLRKKGVRRVRPLAGGLEAWDHLPIKVGPGGVAVEQDDGLGVLRAFVDVVHAEATAVRIGHVNVVGLEGIAIEILESFIGRAKGLQELLFSVSGRVYHHAHATKSAWKGRRTYDTAPGPVPGPPVPTFSTT